MNAQTADFFIMTHSKYFESHVIFQLRETLLKVDEGQISILQAAPLKDPTTSLIVSLLVGALGIDRFMIGDIGMGIGKLLTCGGMGIWAIVDWFLIMGATKEKNMQLFMPLLAQAANSSNINDSASKTWPTPNNG